MTGESNTSVPQVRQIDGKRLRRRGFATPEVMFVMTVLTSYAAFWAAERYAHLTLGYGYEGVPLLVGAGLGCLGLLYGAMNVGAARGAIGSALTVHYLPADHYLTRRVHHLAERLGLPPPAVGVGPFNNAYAVGTSPTDATVVIGIPLTVDLTSEELDAVIGHELGHIASGDMSRMLYVEGFQTAITSVINALTIVLVILASASRRKDERDGLLIAAGASGLLPCTVFVITELMAKGLSRSREYRADAVGAGLTSEEAMAGALHKLHGIAPTKAENRYGYLMLHSRSLGGPFSTHPGFADRVLALKRGTYVSRLPFVGDDAQRPAQEPAAPSRAVVLFNGLRQRLRKLGADLLRRFRAVRSRPAHRVRIAPSFEPVTMADAHERELADGMRKLLVADREHALHPRRSPAAPPLKTRRRTVIIGTGMAAVIAVAAVAAFLINAWHDKSERAALAAMAERQELERVRSELAARLREESEKMKREAIKPRTVTLIPITPTAPPVNTPPTPPTWAPVPTFPKPATAPPSTVAPPVESHPAPTIRPAVNVLTLCDQLAANPNDLDRHPEAPGVPYGQLRQQAQQAVAACRTDAAANPIPRLRYQLARSLQATSPAEAVRIFWELAKGNTYRAANDNLGWMYVSGNGVEANIDSGLWYFRNGTNQGDPDSMVSLARMIIDGRTQPMVPEEEPPRLLLRAAELGNPEAISVLRQYREELDRAASNQAAGQLMGDMLKVLLGAARR